MFTLDIEEAVTLQRCLEDMRDAWGDEFEAEENAILVRVTEFVNAHVAAGER